MVVVFWDGEGQGLSIILGLILAFSLIFSPELTVAFLLGLFLYICLGLGVSKEAPEVTEHKELNKAKELDEMGAACPIKFSVEPATKEKEKEESAEEDMGILITDVRGKEPKDHQGTKWWTVVGRQKAVYERVSEGHPGYRLCLSSLDADPICWSCSALA